MFLDKAPEDISKRTMLYVHTSYPDVGWDIPQLLNKFGISHQVYFTVICKNCGISYPDRYKDVASICKRCQAPLATFIGSQTGVTHKIQSDIYNLFDVYVQYSNCLPSGEKVYVNHQWMNIEDVKVGDVAYTHNNRWMKVKDTFVKNNNRDILQIGIWGDYETLRVTQEHPVYCVKNNINSTCSTREHCGRLLYKGRPLPTPRFVEAKDLHEGDLIAYPIDMTVQDVAKIDLADFCYHTKPGKIFSNTVQIDNPGCVEYARFIDLDDDFCKLIGLFAADGTYNKSNTIITSSSNEDDNISLCIKNFWKIANKYAMYGYHGRNGVDVTLCSKLHTNWFSQFKKHEFRQFPDFVLRLPIKKQLLILQGYFMGDGHYIKHLDTTVSNTISPILADQLKTMLRRCRINFNVSLSKKSGNRKNQYKFEIPGNGKLGLFEINRRKSTRGLYYNGYHLMQVKSIDYLSHNGPVFNFEVEDDNSYVSKIGSIHNSEGLGIPPIEAAACGVPVMEVDYSAMSDVVRKLKGIPIPVKHLVMESASGCYRAIPDNDRFVQQLIEVLNKDMYEMSEWRKQTRMACERHYNWDVTTKTWEKLLDSIPVEDNWNVPPDIRQPNLNVPDNLTNESFVRWGLVHIANRPELIDSYMAARMVRDLTWTMRPEPFGGHYYNEFAMLTNKQKMQQFGRQQAIEELVRMNQEKSRWEYARINT